MKPRQSSSVLSAVSLQVQLNDKCSQGRAGVVFEYEPLHISFSIEDSEPGALRILGWRFDMLPHFLDWKLAIAVLTRSNEIQSQRERCFFVSESSIRKELLAGRSKSRAQVGEPMSSIQMETTRDNSDQSAFCYSKDIRPCTSISLEVQVV